MNKPIGCNTLHHYKETSSGAVCMHCGINKEGKTVDDRLKRERDYLNLWDKRQELKVHRNMLNDLEEFKEAYMRVTNNWTDNDEVVGEPLAKLYPFSISFDEMLKPLNDWIEEYRKHIIIKFKNY